MSEPHPLSSPQRAHTIILTAGGDTAERLADELRFIATLIDQGKLSVGMIGGPSTHAIYSYICDPEMSHDAYFQQIDRWLAANQQPSQPVGGA